MDIIDRKVLGFIEIKALVNSLHTVQVNLDRTIDITALKGELDGNIFKFTVFQNIKHLH